MAVREREREREEKNSVTDSVNVARTDRRRGATPLEWRSFGDKEKKKYSTDESNKKNYAFPLISQREEREKRTKKKKMVLNKGDNGEPLWAPLRVDWTHRNVHWPKNKKRLDSFLPLRRPKCLSLGRFSRTREPGTRCPTSLRSIAVEFQCRFQRFYRVLLGFHKLYWVRPSLTGLDRVFTKSHSVQWPIKFQCHFLQLWPCFTEFYWVSISSIGLDRVWLDWTEFLPILILLNDQSSSNATCRNLDNVLPSFTGFLSPSFNQISFRQNKVVGM